MKHSHLDNKLSKYLLPEESVFLEALLKLLPPQWRVFFESFKTLKPVVLHSFYRLLTYKAKLLASSDEKTWNRLVEREVKILSRL